MGIADRSGLPGGPDERRPNLPLVQAENDADLKTSIIASARTELHLNRRRCKGEHGKALGRKRANLVERAFAHLCGSGAMRRFTTRGLENGQKRYLIQALAYNLGALMRKMHGFGTPRSPRERALLAYLALCWLMLLSMLIGVVLSENDGE